MNEMSFKELWLRGESSQQDSINVKRIYIDINGGNLVDGVMFSQIMYWHGYDKNGKRRLKVFKDNEYWLVKRYEDWWEECRVNEHTARNSVDRMVESSLLIKKIFKFNGAPTVHIRINWEEFQGQISSIWYERSNGNDLKGQNETTLDSKTLTETTAETTTETTSGATPEKSDETTEKQGAASPLDQHFGPKPQPPDNGTPRKPLTADDMLSWGRTDELELQQAEENFLEYGWTINSPAIRLTAAAFFEATPFKPPGDDSTKGYWLKTFKKHSQNWDPKRCLELYRLAYKQMRESKDRNGNPLNVSSPDSLTEVMRAIDLREQTEEVDGPLPVGDNSW